MLQVDLNAFEHVDAGFFSGDCLYTDFEVVKKYVERWSRAVKEHEEIKAREEEDSNG